MGIAACGGTSRDGAFGPEEALPIPARHTSIVAEACTLDAWQLSALQSSQAERVASDVILVCPTIRSNGDVAPLDVTARTALAETVTTVRGLGYKVRLAVTMGDDSASFPVPYPAPVTAAAFASSAWRSTVSQNLAPFAAMADGLEIDLLGMPSSVRGEMTLFFALLDTTVRKTAPLGLMAPPSTMSPSDTLGGDAFDLAQIGAHVDRVRMMTLDYSSSSGPGPDIDPSWAASSAAFGMSLVSVPVDLSFPLYGTDFSDLGNRFVSYDEARAIAEEQHVTLGDGDRDPASGELSFAWVDAAGHAHQTWFEDGVSASRTLNAWSTPSVPASVGVVLYGLGAEDPALWDTLARGLP
jgi:hypothetical protein